MAVKISALPPIVTPALTDVFPVVQSGVTYKETITQLGTLFGFSGAINSVLVTDGSGVPSLNTTLPSGIAATNMSLTTPTIITGALDVNGNNLFGIAPSASAVNYITIANAPASGSPYFKAAGSDTNIVLTLSGKGTGGVSIQGTTAGGSASAGTYGEIISSIVPYASAVSFTTATPRNITSISLTAGAWLIGGNVVFNASSSNTEQIAWVNSTTASVPGLDAVSGTRGATIAAGIYGYVIPTQILNTASPLTFYLSAQATFAAGTVTGSGSIYALRVR